MGRDISSDARLGHTRQEYLLYNKVSADTRNRFHLFGVSYLVTMLLEDLKLASTLIRFDLQRQEANKIGPWLLEDSQATICSQRLLMLLLSTDSRERPIDRRVIMHHELHALAAEMAAGSSTFLPSFKFASGPHKLLLTSINSIRTINPDYSGKFVHCIVKTLAFESWPNSLRKVISWGARRARSWPGCDGVPPPSWGTGRVGLPPPDEVGAGDSFAIGGNFERSDRLLVLLGASGGRGSRFPLPGFKVRFRSFFIGDVSPRGPSPRKHAPRARLASFNSLA